MKSILNFTFLFLFISLGKLVAQPISSIGATTDPDCPMLQGLSMTIHQASNTFDLTFNTSSQYMVWDLYQKTSSGTVLIGHGSSFSNIYGEPINANLNDGLIFVQAANVCDGDGTYDGANRISKIINITAIEDSIVAFVDKPDPDGDLCETLSQSNLTLNICNSPKEIIAIIFGCDIELFNSMSQEERLDLIASDGVLFTENMLLSEDQAPGFDWKNGDTSIKITDNDWIKSVYKTDGVIPCASNNKISPQNNIKKPRLQSVLSPNPTDSQLNMNLEIENQSVVNISIMNLQSQVVRVLAENQPVTKGKFNSSYDVSDLASGMYLVSVRTLSGIQSYKFIKK